MRGMGLIAAFSASYLGLSPAVHAQTAQDKALEELPPPQETLLPLPSQQDDPLEGPPIPSEPSHQPGQEQLQPGYGSPDQHGYVPPPPPKTVPPPKQQEGVYLHDGFYVRMSLGGALLRASLKPSDETSPFTIQDVGVGFDLSMGGTPAHGFVLGGRIVSMVTSSPTGKLDGKNYSMHGSSRLSMVQVFADFYPAPREGFHVSAAMGPANYGCGIDEPQNKLNGLGLSLGAGWGGWVAEQWSLGGMLALTWVRLAEYDVVFHHDDASESSSNVFYSGKAQGSVLAPTLTFEVTYH